MINKLSVFLLFSVFYSFSSISQIGNKGKYPSYFGFQVRTIFPTQFIGEKALTISNESFSTTITQKMGYSFGATVRAGLTELIAFETGINFTQRYFSLDMVHEDSSLIGKNEFGFIQYDIPINALIYIKFNDEFYMNASFGLALGYKPSSVGVITNVGGVNQFFNIGLVDINKKLGIDLNANLGFEYRTKRAGIYYIGGSARLPLSPLFGLISEYRNANYRLTAFGEVEGTYLSLDFKYFLPNFGGGGRYKPHGPIE